MTDYKRQSSRRGKNGGIGDAILLCDTTEFVGE